MVQLLDVDSYTGDYPEGYSVQHNWELMSTLRNEDHRCKEVIM